MHDDLEMMIGDKKIPTRILFKRMVKYVKPEWAHFLLAFIFLAINVAFNIAFPYLMGKLTDNLQSPSISLKVPADA